ncbi:MULTISPECIES: transthyretin [unclassified Prochlorococcus]|uniref:transthyretin n=3 Tax=unclassified Prochlorococcus TaxID=2627481 RepID=UPI001F4C633C|nr:MULTISPECIES: transthyretin [unclassified Prochlorococcus]
MRALPMIHLTQLSTALIVTLGMVFMSKVVMTLVADFALLSSLKSLMVLMVRGSYAIGRTFGIFYWRYLHSPLRLFLIQLLALMVTLVILAFDACRHIWQYRLKVSPPSVARFTPAH